AERLGADVNAHTDKDHTAFHMRGLARDALTFVPMLAELVTTPTFPADELERERQVLLQEFVEDDDDPMAAAYRLFDTACYGLHPVAQPAIGRRATVERLQADDLRRWVERQFTGANLVLAAAGSIDADAFRRAAEAAFGGLPAGTPHTVAAPDWRGGLRTRRLDAGSQTHLVLGYPLPPLTAADPIGELAAACFGEGMSSPLMAELRERRGLVYYAACAADVLDLCGEFVVEASFAADKLDELLPALTALLRAQAEADADPVTLERARNQLAVRWLRAHEKPARRLEAAALDLFALGRVRALAERLERLQAVDADAVRATFEHWQRRTPPAVALAGKLVRGVSERVRAALAPLQLGAPVPPDAVQPVDVSAA
ncbi:MAG: pitrilysin family protein, partial [Rubrivivax sp.]